MFLIVGYVIILAAALGTYAIHGSLLALWVPAEYVACRRAFKFDHLCSLNFDQV